MCLCSVVQKYEIKKQLIPDFNVIFANRQKTIKHNLTENQEMQIPDLFTYEQFVRIAKAFLTCKDTRACFFAPIHQ